LNCKELISNLVPELGLMDTADKALDLMNEYHLIQLPLVNEGRYLGLVSEDALLDWEDTNIAFGSANAEYFKPAILDTAHVYEALNIFQEFKCCIIPVINKDNIYQGSITSDNLLQNLIQGTQSSESGGIIVISCSDNNYSLSQIARVFEGEGITILSLQVHTNKTIDPSLLITIKTNKQDLRALSGTLERLNYFVEEVYSEINNTEDLQTNFDSLMKYLDF
jgi:acetoin utilization protein AcuB